MYAAGSPSTVSSSTLQSFPCGVRDRTGKLVITFVAGLKMSWFTITRSEVLQPAQDVERS